MTMESSVNYILLPKPVRYNEMKYETMLRKPPELFVFVVEIVVVEVRKGRSRENVDTKN